MSTDTHTPGHPRPTGAGRAATITLVVILVAELMNALDGSIGGGEPGRMDGPPRDPGSPLANLGGPAGRSRAIGAAIRASRENGESMSEIAVRIRAAIAAGRPLASLPVAGLLRFPDLGLDLLLGLRQQDASEAKSFGHDRCSRRAS